MHRAGKRDPKDLLSDPKHAASRRAPARRWILWCLFPGICVRSSIIHLSVHRWKDQQRASRRWCNERQCLHVCRAIYSRGTKGSGLRPETVNTRGVKRLVGGQKPRSSAEIKPRTEAPHVEIRTSCRGSGICNLATGTSQILFWKQKCFFFLINYIHQ